MRVFRNTPMPDVLEYILGEEDTLKKMGLPAK